MNTLSPLPGALNGPGGRTPALPPGAPLLLRSLGDEDLDFKEIAALVERVPPVAARLIGLANSAWSAPVAPIVSVEQACSRIGMDVVRSIAMGMTAATPFNPKRCASFDSAHFWTSALLSADLAARLAEAVGTWCDMDRDSARTTGLLHNLGLLWLADRMPVETGKAIDTVSAEPDRQLDSVLAETCGIGYAAAGAYLGHQWELPEPLNSAIRHHADHRYQGDGWQAARLIGIAASIASHLHHGLEWSPRTLEQGGLPISEKQQQGIVARAAAKLESTGSLVRALFP